MVQLSVTVDLLSLILLVPENRATSAERTTKIRALNKKEEEKEEETEEVEEEQEEEE